MVGQHLKYPLKLPSYFCHLACTHWRAAAANFALQNALVLFVFVIVNKGQTVSAKR